MASSTTSVSSMGQISFGGMSSGLDTDTLIEQLVEVDSKTLVSLQADQEDINTKKDTYTTIKSDLSELQSLVSELRTSADYGEFSASSSDEDALTVKATTSAATGNYSIKVLALAEAESISSDSFEDSDTALGITGEIAINGKALEINASDTLTDIKNSINSLDNGVTATVLKVSKDDLRLILTADDQGSDGFTMGNVGGTDVLGALGLSDGTKVIRESGDGSVYSLGFDSAASTIGSLVGASSATSGTVEIRGTSFEINLATDTLTSIRDKINSLGISGVSASIETVTTDDDTTQYRLAITGTENFTDSGNVLETLGILEGGTADVTATFRTGKLDTTGTIDVTTSTALTSLGAVAGDTITISGTGADGKTVSNKFTVEKNSTVEDLLSAIESAFSDKATAELSDGRIVIQSVESGETSLAVNLTAKNSNDGTLDFGSMETVAKGRDRQLSEGRDATILVNNTTISRSTNEISDAITGVKLSLRNADENTTLNVTVTRDTDAIKDKIKSVVDAYNELVSYIDEQAVYDQKTDTAGPLTGDMTARSIVSRLRTALQSSIDTDGEYSSLTEIGIEFNEDGELEINTSKLNEALESDMDSVISLFTVNRDTSNNDIRFVYSTTDTAAGSYDVVITQAAEKASVSASETMVTESGSLTLADNYGNTMTVDYEAGELAADVANRVNAEAGKSYQEIIASDEVFLTDSGSTVTQDTSIDDIAGVEVKTGDTITIKGTDQDGKSFQKRLTFSSTDDYTIDDILSAIEDASDNTVTASLDSGGHIIVQDKTSGASDLSLSISTTVSGLTFGTFGVEQEGRDSVKVTAAASADGTLTVYHKSYGSSNTFTVSGGQGLGITSGTYAGVDVAGTINGTAGTGKGQNLTAASSDSDTKGITLLVTSTAEEVASGTAKSEITLTSGIADLLYTQLSHLTNSVDGVVQTKLDSIDLNLETLDTNISEEESRIEQRRAMYEKQFTILEVALARLQNMQSQLSSLLNSL